MCQKISAVILCNLHNTTNSVDQTDHKVYRWLHPLKGAGSIYGVSKSGQESTPSQLTYAMHALPRTLPSIVQLKTVALVDL
jgi:hypothetical protein